jgi:hypothetical protein
MWQDNFVELVEQQTLCELADFTDDHGNENDDNVSVDAGESLDDVGVSGHPAKILQDNFMELVEHHTVSEPAYIIDFNHEQPQEHQLSSNSVVIVAQLAAMMQSQSVLMLSQFNILSTSQKSLFADLDSKFATYSARVDARAAEMHVRFGEVDDRIAKVELENRVLLRQVGDLQTSLVDIRQNIIDVTQNNFEELVVEPMALEIQSCDFDDELEVHGVAMALESQSCDFDDVLEVHSIVALNGSCMDLAATFPFGGTLALGTQSSEFDDELEAHGGSMALETRSCDFDDELEVLSIAPEIQTCDFDDELEAHGGTMALEIQSCDLAAQELMSAASGRTFDMGVIDQVLSFNGDLCGCGDIYLSELVIAFCLRLRSHELYGPLSLLPLPASFWQAQASHCICGFAKSLREAIRQPGSLDSKEIFERYVDKAAFHFLEVMHGSARELELC